MILLGAALRIVHLGQASFWNDEFFSRYYPDLGLGFLWGPGFTRETTPPTYYTLLLGWMHLFGASEAALRALSAIGSVATIPLVYLLACEFAGRPSALLAALLFAIAPMQIYYAQEARVYALTLPLACLVLLGMARYVQAPRAGHLMLYGVSGVISVYLHNICAILLASCNLAFLTMLSGRRPAVTWPMLRAWIIANATVAALCLPEAVAMLRELQADRLGWISPRTWRDVLAAVGTVISGPAVHPLRLNLGLGLLFCLAVGAGVWIVRLDRRAVTILLLVPGIEFTLILLAGLRQPVLEPRILCWLGVPISVLAACVLTPSTRVRPALAAAVGVVLLVGLAFQFFEGAKAKEPWRLLLAQLQPEIARADLIVVGPWTQPLPLLYYGQDMAKVRHWHEYLPETVESTVISREIGTQEISRDALLADLRAGKRVLLIQREVEYYFQHLLTDVTPPQREWQRDCGRSFCMKGCTGTGLYGRLSPRRRDSSCREAATGSACQAA
ncbi:MAG TPA: glycosyltransferase family 39 protein [Rhodopila sp.]|nr:glycosyltransferase family 39 protein [Rhodopila sp.]